MQQVWYSMRWTILIKLNTVSFQLEQDDQVVPQGDEKIYEAVVCQEFNQIMILISSSTLQESHTFHAMHTSITDLTFSSTSTL